MLASWGCVRSSSTSSAVSAWLLVQVPLVVRSKPSSGGLQKICSWHPNMRHSRERGSSWRKHHVERRRTRSRVVWIVLWNHDAIKGSLLMKGYNLEMWRIHSSYLVKIRTPMGSLVECGFCMWLRAERKVCRRIKIHLMVALCKISCAIFNGLSCGVKTPCLQPCWRKDTCGLGRGKMYRLSSKQMSRTPVKFDVPPSCKINILCLVKSLCAPFILNQDSMSS